MRKNVHLSDSVEAKAGDLIKEGVGDGLSDLIARLIREEWDRRHGIYPIRIPGGGELNEKKEQSEQSPESVNSSKTPPERPAGRTIRRIHERSKESGAS